MILDDDVVTDEEKIVFANEIVHNTNFPVYHTFTHVKFKYDSFVHILLKQRLSEDIIPLEDRINSSWFPFFNNILKRFCDKHNIEIKELRRGAVNITFSIEGLKMLDAHVDHTFDHKVFILYLNDLPFSNNNNSTIIFDQKREDFGLDMVSNDDPVLSKKLTIQHEVYPKAGRCILFDGNFHAIKNPLPTYLRYICIMSFT